MKVSVVTVSYNSIATIQETLDSVLSQSGVELEYIVVDGGSRDGTAELIASYGSRLAWWISEPDRGQVDALNKGFARATGDILTFLNADDVLLPHVLKLVCDKFAASPDRDVVYGGIEWIDFEGSVIGSHLGDISNLQDILNIYEVWWAQRQWVQPEVFFRRSLKEQVGAFDEQYQLAFDYDFWVRCFLAGARPTRITSPLVRFRRHPGQKSTAYAQATAEIRAILGRHLASKPPIGTLDRVLLEAQLSYDLYQTGEAETRPSFGASLLRHPMWLLSPQVRRRLATSLHLIS